MKRMVILFLMAGFLMSMTVMAMSDNDKAQPSQKQKDLLVIAEKSFVIDQTPPANRGDARITASGDIRVYAEVTNGRPMKATNVTATCAFEVDDATEYDSRTQTIGTLAAGEKKEIIFYFPSKGYAEDYRSRKRVLSVKADKE